VFDNCGVGIVQTFTVNQNLAGIIMAPPVFSNIVPPSCTSTQVTNTISPATGTILGYPLVITYTINPPAGGSPIVITTNLAAGNPTSQNLTAIIPDYVNQNFDYDLTILDACNSIYTQNFLVDKNIALSSTIIVLDCDQNYFEINTTNFTPPYSLNFTTVPPGFNPSTYNTNYPGPYNQAAAQFGGSTAIVPFGQYSLSVSDFCGRIATHTFIIVPNPPLPSAVGSNNGCLTNTGNIVVTIPSYTIATALVLVAPAGFPQTLPYDASALIDTNGNLKLDPVPLGNYVIQITDKCNSILLPLNCIVPVYSDLGLAIVKRPGCDLQKASIELSSKNGKLVTVSITNAPAAYSQVFPIVISNNIISNGNLYLNDLPAGNYTFSAIDECNYSNTITINVTGYAITTSIFSLQPNCGSFDIPLNFVSNGVSGQSFWLQKLIDPLTNSWGNPVTNSIYAYGTVPDATNSLVLNNNTTNFNLSFNGDFRIIREFISFNNGVSINNLSVAGIDKECIEILSPIMTFHQALEITDATRIPCTVLGNLDVVISANGTLPLKYSITTKDGNPFLLDNGTSNIFYNLASGIYTFQVEDNCGNIINRIYDVSVLLSLVNMTQPNDILQCQNTILGNELFDLSQQNAIIYGTQSTSNYTLTYYTSMANAISATNAIANLTNFNPATNPQTIYARMIFNSLPNCYEIRDFDLIVGQIPVINLVPDYLNCSASPITLDASVGNLPSTTYSWSNGAITPSIIVTQLGVTSLIVASINTYGIQSCTNTKSTEVTISQQPKIDHIEFVDWTPDENSITVITSGNGDFEYSLDGIVYQSDAIFSSLVPGVYNVYVNDKKGCGTIQQTIWLLYYKRYFTPNGDGINESWNIENSSYEPDLKVVIYDRYGKAITSFDSNSAGWDGTYNGQLMFASDYWFVVYRQGGRIHKGHFSLKR
jgi:gliding motility-associated-like protein